MRSVDGFRVATWASKRGELLRCRGCGEWRPEPRNIPGHVCSWDPGTTTGLVQVGRPGAGGERQPTIWPDFMRRRVAGHSPPSNTASAWSIGWGQIRYARAEGSMFRRPVWLRRGGNDRCLLHNKVSSYWINALALSVFFHGVVAAAAAAKTTSKWITGKVGNLICMRQFLWNRRFIGV